jgi:hypothetical protein
MREPALPATEFAKDAPGCSRDLVLLNPMAAGRVCISGGREHRQSIFGRDLLPWPFEADRRTNPACRK